MMKVIYIDSDNWGSICVFPIIDVILPKFVENIPRTRF